MKVLFIFSACLVYLASASFYDALEHDSEDLLAEFKAGMNLAPHLAEIIPEYSDEANFIEQEVKGQLASSLQEVLSGILQRIRETFGKAGEAAKNALAKVKELVEKLKNLTGVGEELKERIAEKVREWIGKFLEKLSQNSQMYSLVRVPLELDEKNLMENVKQNILERLNLKDFVEFIKSKLAKLGEIGRFLLEAVQQPGALEKLRGLIEMILPGLRGDYSLKDLWGKVRDFFKGLGVKIAEKFSAFSNWLKGVAQKGWEQIKDKAGKLKEIAKVVASKAGSMSKQALEQALEYFKENKEVIGKVAFELVKKAIMAALTHAVG